jgi:hypothetical protein
VAAFAAVWEAVLDTHLRLRDNAVSEPEEALHPVAA